MADLSQHVRMTYSDKPFTCSCEPHLRDGSRSYLDHLRDDVLSQPLRDLAERLKQANNNLMERASEVGGAVEEHRIYGKAEGVRLALSYVEEALR